MDQSGMLIMFYKQLVPYTTLTRITDTVPCEEEYQLTEGG